MCQRSGVFLILNCLSAATFFRQTSPWFLASLLTLSTELSARGGENEEPREEGGGGEKKCKTKLAQRDKSEISKDWMLRDE